MMNAPHNNAMVGLVLGHSFVRRMKYYLHEKQDLKLNLQQYSYIYYHGVGGYKLQDLWSEISLVQELQPKVVLLDIGCNDLFNPRISPRQLALDITVERVFFANCFVYGFGFWTYLRLFYFTNFKMFKTCQNICNQNFGKSLIIARSLPFFILLSYEIKCCLSYVNL